MLKDLEERNLIVPVVGNFGGPKALRAVGQVHPDHGATVSAFYLSNVEQYLNQDGIWGAVLRQRRDRCRSTTTSTFIRSARGGGGGSAAADS